jgi:hypothetical protein
LISSRGEDKERISSLPSSMGPFSLQGQELSEWNEVAGEGNLERDDGDSIEARALGIDGRYYQYFTYL